MEEIRRKEDSVSNTQSLFRIIGYMILVSLSLFACQASPINHLPGINSQDHTIEEPFKLFYQQVNGAKNLGPAISSIKLEQGRQVQFFQNGKLVRNPETGHIYIAPLGLQLGFSRPEDAAQSHKIYDLFLPLYAEAGGQFIFGQPLTGLILNEDKGRLEQHFENFGVYQRLEDIDNPFGILNYGVMACGYECRHDEPTYGIIELSDSLHGPFKEFQSHLGDELTGRLMAQPFQLPNGELEAVFENIVLYSTPSQPEQVLVRPIAEVLEMQSDPLVYKLPIDEVVFFAIDGELGHNVARVFIEFLEPYGGIALSGHPLTELHKENEFTYFQIFQNLCLEYHKDAPESEKITIMPLGRVFMAGAPSGQEETAFRVPISVSTWEEQGMITITENQTLSYAVFDNAVPMKGIQGEIVVLLPNGEQHIFLPPVTDENGTASVTIPAINAPHLSLVGFRACVHNQEYGQVCDEGSFLITD